MSCTTCERFINISLIIIKYLLYMYRYYFFTISTLPDALTTINEALAFVVYRNVSRVICFHMRSSILQFLVNCPNIRRNVGQTIGFFSANFLPSMSSVSEIT